MSIQINHEVLIAGAGPVGKTLAIELARHGISHRIIDKAAGPKDISKAMILHARTQEVQELMGVLSDSQAQGKPMKQLQMHAYGKRIATIRTQVDSPHSTPIIIGQDRTERILESHLNRLGGHVEWQTELAGFSQEADHVAATVRKVDGSEEIVYCRYLVGSEGSNSVVRKGLNLTFEGGRYEGEQFIQADCRIKWTKPKGVSHLYLTQEGYMMVIEMPDDIVRIFISLPDTPANVEAALSHESGAAEDKSHAPTLDEIQENLIKLSGVPATLSDATWLARYRTSHRYANKFREGRVFIAGDAAHVHVPLGGQGMNTGIQDAFNLGWKLAYVLKGLAKPELLDTYNEERHPVAKALIEGTNKGYTTILHPSELAQAAVRQFGPFLLSSDFVRTKLMETLEEIRIGYHRSSLTEEHRGTHGVQAGDRAPDALVVRLSDCETFRIHQLLQGTHWTLFAFAGGKPRAEEVDTLLTQLEKLVASYPQQLKGFAVLPELQPVEAETITLIDSERFAHEHFGIEEATYVLIRPDGYIGFRGRASDGSLLAGYLSRILDRGQVS